MSNKIRMNFIYSSFNTWSVDIYSFKIKDNNVYIEFSNINIIVKEEIVCQVGKFIFTHNSRHNCFYIYHTDNNRKELEEYAQACHLFKLEQLSFNNIDQFKDVVKIYESI